MCVCVFVTVFVSMSVGLCVMRLYACVSIYMYVCVNVFMHICFYVCSVFVCMCVYV